MPTHFKHPSVVDGAVSFEDSAFPVKAGVVRCPHGIGTGADWRHATPAEIAAYEAAPDEGAPDADDEPVKKKAKK